MGKTQKIMTIAIYICIIAAYSSCTSSRTRESCDIKDDSAIYNSNIDHVTQHSNGYIFCLTDNSSFFCYYKNEKLMYRDIHQGLSQPHSLIADSSSFSKKYKINALYVVQVISYIDENKCRRLWFDHEK